MESKMNEFIKITEGEKVALIDPVGKVCLINQSFRKSYSLYGSSKLNL